MTAPMEATIAQIILEEMASLNRPDLYRAPLTAFSSARDSRYARLKELIGPWHLSPVELLPEAESVISYFVPFTKEVAAGPGQADGGSALWGEAYQVINRHFARINEALSRHLTAAGHQAATIPATHTYDPKDMQSMWSHKSAAAIAGLGVFGANRILITAKGSGGRFCSVITSATLSGAGEPATNRCRFLENGSCGLCFRACPAGALTPEGLDRFACQEVLFQNGEELKQNAGLDKADTCGKCISVCPVAYIQ